MIVVAVVAILLWAFRPMYPASLLVLCFLAHYYHVHCFLSPPQSRGRDFDQPKGFMTRRGQPPMAHQDKVAEDLHNKNKYE
jgi:hypothetical protein